MKQDVLVVVAVDGSFARDGTELKVKVSGAVI